MHEKEGLPHTHLDQLVNQPITRDLFGKFVDYLMTETAVGKVGTVQSYVSKMKMIFEETHSDSEIHKGRWYSMLRKQLLRDHIQKCTQEGTRLADHAVPMQIYRRS